MKYTVFGTILLILTINMSLLTWAKGTNILKLQPKHGNSAFDYPSIQLEGIISEIFEFYDAEWISGLTCRIKYNGKAPLPSKVFFSIFDKKGKETAHKVRLIYPKLKEGQSGIATFRIKGDPALIIIWAEGEGPYNSPY